MQIQNELRGFFVKLGMQLELPGLLPKFDGRTYFIKLCVYFHYQYSSCCCGCCRLGNDGLAAGTASTSAAAGDATLQWHKKQQNCYTNHVTLNVGCSVSFPVQFTPRPNPNPNSNSRAKTKTVQKQVQVQR